MSNDLAVKEDPEGAPLKKTVDDEGLKVDGTQGGAVEATEVASGWVQVGALMEKNALTKLRTPAATLAEVLSPILLMVVLWVAYDWSDVHSVSAKMFHAVNVELPFFWKNASEEFGPEEMTGDWDPSDSHRRQLNDLDLEEASEESPTLGKWIRMLGGHKSVGEGAPEEEMSLVNDLLMMSHFRDLMSRGDDDGYFASHPLFDDEVIDFDKADEDKDVHDSGDWWEEVLADVRKETVEKMDWNELQEEVQENLGEIWEDSKAYILYQGDNDPYTRLDQLRVMVEQILERPLVVPTFGQYVWGSTFVSSFINVKRNLPWIFQYSSYGRQWGNFLTLGTIHLSPEDHPATLQFKEYLEHKYPAAMKLLTVRTHADQNAAMDFVMGHLNERTWAVIDLSQLEQDDSPSHGGSFTIRMNSTTVPNTALVENYVAMGLSTRYQRYYLSGYLTLQRTVNDFVMWQSGCEVDPDLFWSMPMPTAAYEQNVFFLHVGYLLGLVLVMAFLYPSSRLIQSLVDERESRMKETLLILGVRPWAHTVSWIFTSALTFGFITFLMTIVLRFILTHTSFMLIWLWMGMFSLAGMSFCFFVASLFSKAKLAAVVGPMALFASLLPRFIFFGTNRYEAITAKYFASILPGTALAFGADIVGDYEYGEQTVGDHIWAGDYSFGSSMFFLAFDTIFYLVLAWYAEQVIPREYGAAAQPWYFPLRWFLPSYWNRTSSAKTFVGDIEDDDASLSSVEKDKEVSKEDICIESVTDAALIPRVIIKDLVKSYSKNAEKPAVKNMDLTLYESQITALLGHNGAGKTSTVSVMTGLFPPTSGDVSIYGNSITSDLAKARQSIGICPQHNVLFDCLTVLEHLKFFSKIKGADIELHDLEARALEIGLSEDQLQTTASSLSGGNQRKLSVAIAMCGDPKVLILDEPTSAMDPTARRRCWQVLRRKREGRVILLTTHFMDEAEHLSDRVAVMKEGELQCCGSPLYLKDKYNLGWNLTVVMHKSHGEEICDDDYAGTQFRITSFLQQYIPQAELVRRSGRELTYCLPKGTEELFPDAFDAFEEQSQDLGVSSYGVENASFEEVFLLLAEKTKGTDGADEDISIAETGSVSTDNDSFRMPSLSSSVGSDNESSASSEMAASVGDCTKSTVSDSGSTVVENRKVSALNFKDTENFKGMSPLRQISLLYWKRAIIQKRDWKGAFFAIFVPVILVAIIILVLTAKIVVSGPPIELSPALYQKSYSAASGSQGTQVLVGGGAGSSKTSVYETEHFLASEGSALDYSNVQVQYLRQDASSSAELSRYLLDTYNDHDHPVRFGAYAFDDVVVLNVTLDFQAFREQIEFYEEKMSWDIVKLRDQRIDLLEVFGLEGTNGYNGRFLWRFNVGDFAESFVERTSLNPHVRVKTEDLQRLTRAALNGIFVSSDKDIAQARADYEQELRVVADKVYEGAVAFFDVTHINKLEANASQLVSTFVDEALETLESDKMMEDLELSFKLLVASSFENRTSEADLDVLRWKGDLSTLAQAFWKELRTLGEDPEKDRLSLYDLTEKFVLDGVDLADKSLKEVTNGTYSVNTFEDAIFKALHGGSDEDEFDRQVIEREMSALIEGAVELFGAENVVVDKFVHSTLGWIEGRLDDYSDGEIRKIPGKALVTPLILVDFVLEKWNSTTITLQEAFQYLSDGLGGTQHQLNGFLSVRARDIVLDFGKLAIELEDIFVSTGDGTFLEIDQSIPLKFTLDSLQALVPNSETIRFQFDLPSKTSLLHNSSSPHAIAVFNQAHMEDLYKQCIGDSSTPTRLTSVNHPLPLTEKQSLEIKVMLSVVAGLFILIPFCYIPATFIVFLVKERITKSKHLQLVSGVNMSAYWIATYLWDMTLYLLLTICIMIVFLFYGDNAEVFIGNSEAFWCTFALTFGYGLSSLPFSYLLSRTFNNCSTAQISVAGIGWVSGFVTVICYVTMYSLPKTEHIAVGLQPWFRLFPAYNVGEGFISISQSFWEREILGIEKYPSDWDVMGVNIFHVYILALPYFLLVLMLEYANDGGSGGVLGRFFRLFQRFCSRLSLRWHGIRTDKTGEADSNYAALGEEGSVREDQDVVNERQYVEKNQDELRQTAPVVLLNLWKIYPPSVGVVGSLLSSIRSAMSHILFYWDKKVFDTAEKAEEKSFVPKQAVRGVSTAIMKGETYALLGANGAGKTTTMGMLTGDITSTHGTAYIAGHNATGESNSGVSEARKNIGFCPQKDPLLDLMTGRETLTMFARLRGVPTEDVSSLVDELLEQLTLTPHADKVTKALSGGNKRKLSLGLALIGDPSVLLIDESSSGLDPLAKRRMWDLIEQAGRTRSVILTTHSMQEAEALCTRVAIMVKGQFVCLGSVQHLKNKYMDGYSIDVFCKSSASDEAVDLVESEVLYALPGCSVAERFGRFLRFEVANVSCMGLGTCFRRLQELKNHPDLPVENYAVSQSSLEQIFVKLVSDSNDVDDDLEQSRPFTKASF